MDLISDYEAIKDACETSYMGVSMISTEVLKHVLLVFEELKSSVDKFVEESKKITQVTDV